MQENYFKTLFKCALVSFGVLIVATVASAKGLHLPPWLAMGFALAPLAFYHRYLAKRAAKGLSQAAIDSVYYFGFLVTVAALGISAISIAVGGAAESLSTVIYQFGVGLFATGYAVIARMHLTAKSTQVEAASPEAIMDRYIKKSLEMVDNVEMASVRLADFSQMMMAKSVEVSETARVAAEKAMLDVARSFESEMKSSLSLATQGLQEIRGLVSDTSFNMEREELSKSVKATVEAVTGLNKALQEMTVRSKEGAQATQQSAIVTARLDESLTHMYEHIDQFSGADGGLAKASRNIVATGGALDEAAKLIGHAVHSISSIGADVEQTGPVFKTMSRQSKKAHEQLEALSGITERLSSSLSAMEKTADASVALAATLERATDAMPKLAANAETLGDRLEKVCLAAEAMEAGLSSIPQQAGLATTVANDVVQALKAIANQVATTVEQAKALSAGTAEVVNTAQATQMLLGTTEGLKASIHGLEQHLTGLSKLATSTQHTLNETTVELRAALKASADGLEADVRRSSQASSLLTESLSNVAKTIVDQTRQRMGTAQ